MRIAIPVAQGRLSPHFGHCEKFALVDVSPEEKKVMNQEEVESPTHQPGLLPQWLGEQGVNLIIAGGIGQRAVALFNQKGIEVVSGAPVETPPTLVAAFLDGSLQTGQNSCDH